MYIKRLVENLVHKAFFIFEIFSFEVDAYMYIQKTYFCAVAYSVKISLALVLKLALAEKLCRVIFTSTVIKAFTQSKLINYHFIIRLYYLQHAGKNQIQANFCFY
jgi:hypothetical protein